MARATQVKMGQIWEDSKGRQLEIIELQGADKKFEVLNHSTNRSLRRGPRALVKLIKRGPPGAQPAARPPTKKDRKRRAAKQREMTPAQLAHFGRGKARKGARRELGMRPNPPALSAQTPSYPMSNFRGSPPFEPGASPFSGMNPGVFGYPDAYSNPYGEADFAADFGPDEFNHRPNPSHYPSELAEFVCVQISQMDPRHAEIPAMVMRRVGTAISEWTTQVQRSAAANPHRY